MAMYELRYFFDAGSGICLWSGNDAAREAFDYPIDLRLLKLSPMLESMGEELIVRYDTSIDWSYPPAPSPWSKSQEIRFRTDSQNFLDLLRTSLGPNFTIRDECTGTT